MIYDILHETKKRQLPGLLLLVDFEKAFDSIEWPFIQKTLKFFGFKTTFCQWVSLLYAGIKSSIINNGHLSEQFSLTRGVRQGDPLSPYLFILAVECLSAAIKYHPNINGIKIDESEYLISQLADDTTLMLDGSKTSLKYTLSIFSNFEKCSGLKVNLDKTQAIWIGSKLGSDVRLLQEITLDWNISGSFTLLGINFNLYDNDVIGRNYESCLQKIKKLLSSWKWRPLTVIGKITVIKTLALSMLVHLFMTLPNPTSGFFKALESVIYQFIWNGGKDKVKRKTVIGKIDQGGLNMTHLESFCNSLKIAWVRKLLDNSNSSAWKVLFLSVTEKLGNNHVWYGNSFGKCIIMNKVNPFWRDVLRVWENIPRENSTTAQEIMSESLWYNRKITKQNMPIFYPHWFVKNVKYISDLVDDRGVLLSHASFQAKYDITVSFIEYCGLLKLIPNEWKIALSTFERRLPLSLENELISRIKKEPKASKYVYGIFSDSVFEPPIMSQEQWKNDVPEIQQQNWKFYYSIVRKITLESKLQFFQFQILHRILVTNSKLFYYGIKENNKCSFCESTKETIVHLLWDCRYAQDFWADLRVWLNQEHSIQIILDRVSVLFGMLKWKDSISCIVLWAKYYIYCCRCKNIKPSIQGFKNTLANYVRLEKYVLGHEKWNAKWENVNVH